MLLAATVPLAPAALAANPPPVQTYYVPFPEDQVLDSLQTIKPTGTTTPTDPIQTYISIAAIADNTYVYYDQWEDGYEADIANPTNLLPGGTTEIWGDGSAANGCPPNINSTAIVCSDAVDVLNAGDVILLSNPVTSTTTASVIDFDGKDKFAASKTVAATRAAWATGPNTLLAGALEILDTNLWGTTYIAPVGEDTPGDNDMFQYTGLVIMATEDGTTVSIAGGAPQPLNEGQSLLVDGGVNEGDTVVASAPVQIDLVTGDIGASYETRWYTLMPTDFWSDSYYTPVGTSDAEVLDPTWVWLYNPGPAAITVNWTTSAGPETPVNLAVGATGHVTVPNGSGAHFVSDDGSDFYAVSTTDSDAGNNLTHDWGFSLISEAALTSQALVGLGLGRDPTSGTNPNENGSPVWVTTVGNTEAITVYVDYNGDGGALTDPNGSGYDEHYALPELQGQRLYNPTTGEDQTGTLVYILDLRYRLAAAWGQDPATATGGAPGLDVGTGIPPLPEYAAGKEGEVVVDADGNSLPSPGDTLRYTIKIINTSRLPVPDVWLTDTLPLDTTYVTDSTFKDLGDGSGPVQIPDGPGGTLPLESGVLLSPNLLVKGEFTVTFDVQIDAFADLDPGRDEIVNTGVVSALDKEVPLKDRTPLYFDAGIDIEKSTNGLDADSPTGPDLIVGQSVTWTYTVSNTTPVFLANITVTDNQAGVIPQYVSGDSNVDTILDPGEIWIFQATGTVLQGQYTNIGTATGDPVYNDGATPVPGVQSPTATDPSNYVGLLAAIDLQKTVYKGHDSGASCPGSEVVIGNNGDPVTYCFVVTNTGDTYLSDIQVNDPDLGGPVGTISGPLAPSDSATLTLESTIDGPLINTATASGQPVNQENVPYEVDRVEANDVAQVDAVSIDIQKTVNTGHD
jgi:uncharacterized repeat protein (TIGR01451 family)